MFKPRRLLLLVVPLAVAALMPAAAQAVPPNVAEATSTFEYTQNMHPLGFSERAVPLDNTVPGSGVFNSDLAFWGDMAVQGTYGGFRLVDVSSPTNPREIVNWTECAATRTRSATRATSSSGSDLIFRSWNSGPGTPLPGRDHHPGHRSCPVHDSGRVLR